MDLEQKRKQLRDGALHSTTLRLAFVGLSSGLLETLDRAGSISASGLAKRTDSDGGYVTRWLDAAYAFELVESDGQTFRLSGLGESFLPDAPGTMMPLAIQSVLSARIADRLASLVRRSVRPGESILEEFDNITPWFGRMLEGKFRPYFHDNVLPALDFFEAVDDRRGSVLDLGCGNGWYLRALLDEYDGITGVGVDAMEENIDNARKKSGDAGLAPRLRFERTDLFEYRPDDVFDVLVLNRTLHHVWDRREELFSTVDAALAEDGRLVIWEPAWPEERSELRHPERRMLGMRNLAEHAMGNRLLVPDEIRSALEAHDFDVSVERLDPVETLIFGSRA